MAVVGAGMGCLMQITMLVAQNSVQMKDMGVASSSATLFRTLGSSFGVAIMGALFNHRVQDVMAERAGALGKNITEQSAQLDAKSLEKLPTAAREAYQHAVSSGTHSAFLLGAGISVLVLIAALFVEEVPLKGGPQKAFPRGRRRGADGRGRDRLTLPEPRRPRHVSATPGPSAFSGPPTRRPETRLPGRMRCSVQSPQGPDVGPPCHHRPMDRIRRLRLAKDAMDRDWADPGARPGRGGGPRRVLPVPLPARLQGGVRRDTRPVPDPPAHRARRGAAAQRRPSP